MSGLLLAPLTLGQPRLTLGQPTFPQFGPTATPISTSTSTSQENKALKEQVEKNKADIAELKSVIESLNIPKPGAVDSKSFEELTSNVEILYKTLMPDPSKLYTAANACYYLVYKQKGRYASSTEYRYFVFMRDGRWYKDRFQRPELIDGLLK